MSALPNNASLLARLNTGVFVPDDTRGWEQAQRQYQSYHGRTASLRPEQLALGLTLLELRKKTPSGLWGARLKEYGIPVHTSKRAIKAAGMHLGIGRELMAEILCCSLAKLKSYGLPKSSNQQPNTMGHVSHSPELDVGIEDGEDDGSEHWAGDQELADIRAEMGIGEEDQGVDVTVTVDSRGFGTVAAPARAAPEGDLPPVAQKAAVAGRIGPADRGSGLAASRRADVAGQMTLNFEPVEVAVKRQDLAGRGEQARAIVQRHMDEALREIAELERGA